MSSLCRASFERDPWSTSVYIVNHDLARPVDRKVKPASVKVVACNLEMNGTRIESTLSISMIQSHTSMNRAH